MIKRKGESPARSRKSGVRRCVIVNPNAGGAQDRDQLNKQIARLDPERVHFTKSSKDAESRARTAARDGFNEIIAAGGDGTLNAVINGVARARDKIRIGLIPLGTGNDFARCLELPTTVDEAVDVLLAGEVRAIDLVRIKTDRVRHFVNVSTGGFSGLVDDKLTPEIKRTWGSLAYLRGAAGALSQLHGYRTTVVLDDAEEISLCLFNVAIANGRYVAGGLPIAPEAEPADGKLDVVLIPKRSLAETVLLAAEIVLGKHLANSMVIVRRAKKVSVKSRPGMWFNVDGELVGNQPAKFEVLPHAIRFLTATK